MKKCSESMFFHIMLLACFSHVTSAQSEPQQQQQPATAQVNRCRQGCLYKVGFTVICLPVSSSPGLCKCVSFCKDTLNYDAHLPCLVEKDKDDVWLVCLCVFLFICTIREEFAKEETWKCLTRSHREMCRLINSFGSSRD